MFVTNIAILRQALSGQSVSIFSFSNIMNICKVNKKREPIKMGSLFTKIFIMLEKKILLTDCPG